MRDLRRCGGEREQMHYISAIKKVFIKKVRKVKKQISTRRRMHAIKKFGTFDSKELFTHCREIGIRQNDILLVHCSMDNLFTYSGSLTELLQVLQELVAPKGTLLMPALSTNMFMTPTRPFDVQRETTYTGIIPELFRRMSDVIRSLHPRHSLCALGPMAHELTAGHEDCVYADGANSPWDRLRLVGAKGLNLGLRPGVSLTFQHW
ncbi:MAG: AAC(3) family N-acetyltransferase, partial [Synergistales bacterium]|nr:AAC(3) family N-acetyltransferase [Synergistales bacterium]